MISQLSCLFLPPDRSNSLHSDEDKEQAVETSVDMVTVGLHICMQNRGGLRLTNLLV